MSTSKRSKPSATSRSKSAAPSSSEQTITITVTDAAKRPLKNAKAKTKALGDNRPWCDGHREAHDPTKCDTSKVTA